MTALRGRVGRREVVMDGAFESLHNHLARFVAGKGIPLVGSGTCFLISRSDREKQERRGRETYLFVDVFVPKLLERSVQSSSSQPIAAKVIYQSILGESKCQLMVPGRHPGPGERGGSRENKVSAMAERD